MPEREGPILTVCQARLPDFAVELSALGCTVSACNSFRGFRCAASAAGGKRHWQSIQMGKAMIEQLSDELPTRPRLTALHKVLPLLLVGALLAGGCAFNRRQNGAEEERLAAAAGSWLVPYEQRELPVLTEQPDWQEVLQRAFAANGELEAAYHRWAAAVARLRGRSSYPDGNLALGYDYMFSRERMKTWDRTTLSVGFDPGMMLQWPGKVAQQGRIALEELHARRLRFEAAKFGLQERVLSAYLDYALQGERLRLQGEQVRLLDALVATAEQQVRTGGPQTSLLQARIELEMANNDLAAMTAELPAMKAMLASLLALSPTTELLPPARLPELRPLPPEDGPLLAMAVERNPELQALGHEAAAQSGAVKLAGMAYFPDIAPQFSITGSISRAVGAMFSLPGNLTRVRSSIEEARAMLREAEAEYRQARLERAAQFVAALRLVRDLERQRDLLQDLVLPQLEQQQAILARSLATGGSTYGELIEIQRSQLALRLLIAEAQVARERKLLQLETLAGVDSETLLERD